MRRARHAKNAPVSASPPNPPQGNDPSGRPQPPPIELVPDVRPPRLPGRVILRESVDDALDALLADIYLQGLNCIRVFGSFQLAVPCSRLGELMLGRMMYDPTLREFPWARTRVWLTHDPGLPSDDPASGIATLRDLLAEHSGIAPDQLHAADWSQPDPAAHYAATLREHLGWREKGHDRLDAVMLEMAPDGALGLADGPPGSLCELLANPQRPGISMTYEMINATRLIAVVPARASDFGSPVSPALAALDLDAPRERRARLPATKLGPLAGELRWYVGKDVCPPPSSALPPTLPPSTSPPTP